MGVSAFGGGVGPQGPAGAGGAAGAQGAQGAQGAAGANGAQGAAGPSQYSAINPQSADYTIVVGDQGALVRGTKGSAQAITIPTDAAQAFPVGAWVDVTQAGTGAVTITAVTPGTTTVVSAGATSAGPVIRAKWSACTLIKVGANSWQVVGDIV